MLTSALSSSPTVNTALTGASSTASSIKNSASETQDRFLKLLVAQLNNQDPMNPMDNAQMTSQMAQMSTVSGIEQVNDTLKSMADQFNTMQMLQGSSMVGHNVLIEGNSLVPVNGVAVGAIDLAGSADSVKVEILSPGGVVIDTIQAGSLDSGRNYFSWDASKYAESGNPTFRVTAKQGDRTIEATTLTRDVVVSVGMEAGAMTVQLQGKGTTAYSNIKAIL
jgi:flagellar basal-body rod modification protein FlgD